MKTFQFKFTFHLLNIGLIFIFLWIYCNPKFHIFEPVPIETSLRQITQSPWGHETPAWSPSGQYLAFSKIINTTELIYYTLSDGLESGSIARINDVLDMRIALSPDGEHIVYRSIFYGHLWIYSTLDESIRLLTPKDTTAFDPAWSQDGSRIAYISRNDDFVNELKMISPEGGSKTTLFTAQEGESLSWPSWSPDGTHIVFTHKQNETSRIAIFSFSTHDTVLITSDTFSAHSPAWSPLGDYIAFCKNQQEIALITVDGSELVYLENQFNANQFKPSWSPDASCLVISIPNEHYIVSLINDTSFRANMSNYGGNKKISTIVYPQWLPDGKAFVGAIRNGNSQNIHVVDLETGQLAAETKPYGDNRDSHPTWFSNQDALIFQRERKNANADLIQLALIDQRLSDLDIERANDPAISPDDSSLLCVQYNDKDPPVNSNRWFLTHYNLNTMESYPIILSETVYTHPSWAPDSRKFVCTSNYGLHIFNKNRYNQYTEEAFLPGHFENPNWSPENPVFGSHIAVHHENNIFLVYTDTYEKKCVVVGGRDPCWSPDGTQIAYVSLSRGDDQNSSTFGQICIKTLLYDLSE
ncbi:DPP IV N-terminal domain-containing protein [bacterium]